MQKDRRKKRLPRASPGHLARGQKALPQILKSDTGEDKLPSAFRELSGEDSHTLRARMGGGWGEASRQPDRPSVRQTEAAGERPREGAHLIRDQERLRRV